MKDAKGHGSDARGGNAVDTVYSSKAGVGGLGKGMYARLHSGQQLKLNPAATDGRIPSVGSTLDPSQHTLVPAHSEGVAAVGQWAHFDKGGRSLQIGDTVHDPRTGNMAKVTSTHFENGDPNGKPLVNIKSGGVSMTRDASSVVRSSSHEENEYNRDLALRIQNKGRGPLSTPR